MKASSSSTASTTPSTDANTSSSSTPTRRRIVVDASKLRHGQPVESMDDADQCDHFGTLIHPRSDCGCLVGVTLAACGVPTGDMIGDAIYYGDHWPDFLPIGWLEDWQQGRQDTPLARIVEDFDRGFETAAAVALRDLFESAGVELVFEHFPDEVQVFDVETDRRAS